MLFSSVNGPPTKSRYRGPFQGAETPSDTGESESVPPRLAGEPHGDTDLTSPTDSTLGDGTNNGHSDPGPDGGR